MSLLPQGWATVEIGDLGRWHGGGTPSKAIDAFWRGGTIPWVSPKDMKRPIIEDAQDKITRSAVEQSSTQLVPSGAVLIVTRSGILKHSLPVAVTAREVAINQDLKALVPHLGINPHFVAAQLKARSREILEHASKAGTTVESIDFGRFLKIPFRLAPSEEQDRIVAKLQPLASRCSAVRDDLLRVSKLAVRQRRAALRRVFAGPKTEQVEPEQAWRVVPLHTLISEKPANGISPPASRDARGALALRLTATTSGTLRLDGDAVKRVGYQPEKGSRYWLKPGDLLVQRANALEHVGAAAIFEGPEETYIYPDLMIRIRIEDPLLRKYVWRYINGPAARQYFQDCASGTAGNMPKITGKILSSLPVSIPPRDLLTAVLRRVEDVHRRIEAVERENARCFKLVDKLEATFLNRAFEGALVPQRAGDEPATTILKSAREADAHPTTSAELPPMEVTSLTLKEFLDKRLGTWPPGGMTFEELRSTSPGSYDEIKDTVFSLLREKQLKQEFDETLRVMKLVKMP